MEREAGSRGWVERAPNTSRGKGCLASWLATEAIRFLCPLKRLDAGWSEPH